MTIANDDKLNHQAMSLLSQGQIASAYAKILEAIVFNPQRVALYFNAASISLQMRQPTTAMQHIGNAIAINANDGDLWMLRGQIECILQKWSEARTSFIRASVISPTQSRPLIELAALSVSQGDYEGGIIYYRHAILLEPTNVHANMALGELYHELNMFIPACTLLKQAVNIAPDNAAAHVSLAASLYRLEHYREALNHLHVSEKINPDNPLLHNNLGMVFNALSDKQNALLYFRKATRLEPKRASSWSNLLLHMHYQADITPQEILLEASNFNAIFSGSGVTKSAEHATTRMTRDVKQKLRIGYVSGDFRQHAVGLFIEPILAHHDKERFDIFAYADVSTLDSKSLRIKDLVHQWWDISTLSHEALLQQIRNDKIDILVDLAGHTANNRLPVFAQRAAPIQITWLGYPGTTGLTNMDYLLTDAIADPDDETQYFMSEKPLRLPYGMFCYKPEIDWAGSVEIALPPAIKNGFITFASFNNLAKVNDACLVLWKKILSKVPYSRLIVKGKPFSDPHLVAEWRVRLSKLDLPNDRIQLLPYEKLQAHFASYNEVDILLDTFPYNGGTTSCDSLWMGVPVVTYTGTHRPARVGASILTQAGKGEWIAKDQTEYVEIAIKLASDVTQLAKVRQQLREDLKQRPMCDAKKFTQALEQIYSSL